jgi:hypothetical protein
VMEHILALVRERNLCENLPLDSLCGGVVNLSSDGSSNSLLLTVMRSESDEK